MKVNSFLKSTEFNNIFFHTKISLLHKYNNFNNTNSYNFEILILKWNVSRYFLHKSIHAALYAANQLARSPIIWILHIQKGKEKRQIRCEI